MFNFNEKRIEEHNRSKNEEEREAENSFLTGLCLMDFVVPVSGLAPR